MDGPTWQTCVSIATKVSISDLAFCGNSTIRTTEAISVPGEFIGADNHTSTIETAFLYGPLIQINFQNTDILSLSSPISTTTSSVQGTAVSTTISEGTYSPTATPNQDQSGLSSGAKIGLGVGIPLGVLAIVAIIFISLWRRQQRRVEPSNFHEAEAPYGDYGTRENIELDGAKSRQEVLGSAVAAELLTDGYGHQR